MAGSGGVPGLLQGASCDRPAARVLKVAPPRVATDDQIGEFVYAIKAVVELVYSSSAFWPEARRLARRALHI
jgi:hypothetical protein